MREGRGIYSGASWRGCPLKIFQEAIFRDTSWSTTMEEEADPSTVNYLNIVIIYYGKLIFFG